MLDTSIDGFAAAGIRIDDGQLNKLGVVNSMMIADAENNKKAASPVFYIALIMRILGALPGSCICEPTDEYGQFIQNREER